MTVGEVVSLYERSLKIHVQSIFYEYFILYNDYNARGSEHVSKEISSVLREKKKFEIEFPISLGIYGTNEEENDIILPEIKYYIR
jgi:hypothetical protein